MRDLGYSDSGIPPDGHELQQTMTTLSDTGDSGTSTSESDNKVPSAMGNVDFSY